MAFDLTGMTNHVTDEAADLRSIAIYSPVTVPLVTVVEGIKYSERLTYFDVEKTNQLVTNWNGLPKFDFLHLGWNYYAGWGEQTIEPVECVEGLQLWKGNHMWLTHGYIVNRKAAQLLLDNTQVQTNGLDAMTAWIQDLMLSYGFKQVDWGIKYNMNRYGSMCKALFCPF